MRRHRWSCNDYTRALRGLHKRLYRPTSVFISILLFGGHWTPAQDPSQAAAFPAKGPSRGSLRPNTGPKRKRGSGNELPSLALRAGVTHGTAGLPSRESSGQGGGTTPGFYVRWRLRLRRDASSRSPTWRPGRVRGRGCRRGRGPGRQARDRAGAPAPGPARRAPCASIPPARCPCP